MKEILLKEKRKAWLFLALVFCFGFLALGQVTALANDSYDDFLPDRQELLNALLNEETEWALCVYLCGSDLESEANAASTDLLEMLAAAPDMPQNMRLFVLTGGAEKWAEPYEVIQIANEQGFLEYGVKLGGFGAVNSEYVGLFEIRRNGQMLDLSEILYYWATTGEVPTTIQDLSNIDESFLASIKNDMGDLNTAKKYLDFIDEAFAPENMMVTFWNHGGGVLKGVAFDELNDYNSLSAADLRDVLQYISNKRGEKIDIVSFDACLMSSMEVAYALSPYADYMIASEEVVSGCGWDYLWLRNLTYAIGADTNSAIIPQAEDIGKAVINAYPATMAGDTFAEYDEAAEYWQDMSFQTMALIDLSKMADLYNDFEKLSAAMLAFDTEADAYHFAEFSRIAGASVGSTYNPDFVDLYEFAYNLTGTFNDETSLLYGHLENNRNGCQDKCQALAAAAAAVVSDFGEGNIERAGAGCVDEYSDSVVVYRGKGASAATSGLSFCLPQIGQKYYLDNTKLSIAVYESLGNNMFANYRAFLSALTEGENNARRFVGTMQLSMEEKNGEMWDVMQIVPEAAGQAVAEVNTVLEYANLQTGKRYVLGESNVAEADYVNKTFKNCFMGSWYAVNGNICSLNVEKITAREYSGDGSNFVEDEYIVYYFDIPGFLNGEPVILLAEAKQYNENLPLADVFVGGYREANRDIEQGAGRLFMLNDENYRFAPVLAGDMEDCSTWEPQPEVTLRSSVNYKLDLGLRQLKSGDKNLYMSYFVVTDLTGAKSKSAPIPLVVIDNLGEMTVMPIPPQLYTGQPVEPVIKLLFMGQELMEEGRDYTVEYGNNVEPGLASVVVTSCTNTSDTLELSFYIVNEDEYDAEYVNWLIDQLPGGHLPGEEFADGIMGTLNSPANEYVVHSLQAEEAMKAYMLLNAEQRGKIAPERVSKLNEHYQAAVRNIITKAEGASEIFGALELMFNYNNDMPTTAQRGIFMMTLGLPNDASAATKANFDAALAAARKENNRVTTAKVYSPYFEQNVPLYDAIRQVNELLQSLDDSDPNFALVREYVQAILNELIKAGEQGVETATQILTLLGHNSDQLGLNVVLKLEVPAGYNTNSMALYGIGASGQERINDINFITENGRQFVVFQTDILSKEYYYALFAEAKAGSSDSGDSGSDGGDGGSGAISGKPGSSKPGTTSSGAITAANIANVFADVQNNAWYSAAIAYVYNNGMMNGIENGFEPNSTTTRAMLVTMLYRLEKEPAAGASSFSDVPAGQWFSKAVAWAAANGVVNGYEDGRFAPNDAITREQLAVILWRYAGSPQISEQLNFTDAAQISDWAAEAMQWAVSAGVIQGDNGALRPTGNATRAEVAQMLMNYLTK